MLVDVDILVPLGSITWEAMFIARDSAAWGAPWAAGEVSGLSRRMESTETMEGVFERFGEIMCAESLLPQETMRLAMPRREMKRYENTCSETV